MISRAGISLIATLTLSVLITASSSISRPASVLDKSTYERWVAESLREMQSVKVGMTRSDLEKVFEREGGLAQALGRTYAYKHCQYFKVDVVFSATNPPGGSDEGENDKITSISAPYLAWPRGD